MFDLLSSRHLRIPKILTLDESGVPGKKPLVYRNKSVLLLGKDSSCDISVQKGIVADKHCIFRRAQGQFWIKAIAPAYLNGERLPEHKEVLWHYGAELTVGEQTYRLTSRVSSWAKSLGMLAVLTFSFCGWAFAQQWMYWGDVYSSQIVTKGVSKESLPDMNKVAEDVEEVFRLSGIPVQALVDQQGVVSVNLKIGSQHGLETLVYSPAMLSIDGLNSLKVTSVFEQASSGIQGVRHLVNGRDKYLVGDDGSRYYLGAKLPGGEVLVALTDDNIVLSNRGQERTVSYSEIRVIESDTLAGGDPYHCVFKFGCLSAPKQFGRGFDDDIASAAKAYSVPEPILKAVINVESAFNPEAVSPAGAMGLMQLMPATAARFGVDDPFDPAQNIMGGAKYLRFLLDRYDNDLTKVLAAYNAGEGAVDRYAGVPPYQETQEYVVKVKQTLESFEQI